MKTPILFSFALLATLLSAPFSASIAAAEQIPDSAIIDNDAALNDDDGKKRFATPELNSEEMQGVYLKSPIELDNTEEQGMRSVTDSERYSETDLLLRERFQGRPGSMQPPQEIDLQRPPAPPRLPPREL